MLIYISYNHNSRSYARKLFNALKKQGMDAWFDDLIEYGDNWETTISQKLQECDAVILILTPQAVSSPTIQAQIEHAKRLNKKIYPLLLEDISENPVPHLRYVDVRGGKLPPKRFYQQLDSLNVHKRLAGDTTTDAPPPEGKKKKRKGK